ncbi:hypothetical protein SJ05684_c20510 [Sinorhizobium sojae CCBAU 05684]|uniref:Uncharacterized protein n=1 Tax=Sinorhizobium sojae CCBAU 05684 TaxID=716928 RepID=A0A249PC40_9HYPH|nr:hypothetical protein SJ05684_c20510 [Sinorhizobium sojae CCBAU 05684]
MHKNERAAQVRLIAARHAMSTDLQRDRSQQSYAGSAAFL